ncbi:MAG: cytochrome P450 [Actinomycetota bacterium]|nr:cytochrome P450 [Actinomycetota bacterium]
MTTLDVLDPSLFVRGVAHETFDWLRANDPVHRDEKNGIWVVSKHADIIHVERQPQLFCSKLGIRPTGGHGANLSIVSMDDPEHARQRKLVSRGFTPGRIGQLLDHIREIARDLIDKVAAQGECDFVDDIAKPLPLIVIAELLGLPIDQRDQLATWSDNMMSAEGASGDDDPKLVVAAEAFGGYVGLLMQLIEERRSHPKDDLISVMLSSVEAGELAFDEDNLDGDELLMFLVLLLVAGNETTRNGLSGGMAALSEFADQRERLASDLTLVNSATEEILRYVSPVISFSRTVTADTELRGRKLEEGDVVLNVYPSANRDEDVFDDPHAFRIDRDPNVHLAFGTGPHFCLGANLARTEIRIALEEIFTRLPDMRVAPGEGPQRAPNSLVTTIDHLPVVFTVR